MSKYFDAPHLLATPPITRAAYSDRTSWIMAELSRLVYEPLPEEVSVVKLVSEIRAAVESGGSEDAVEMLVRRALDSGQEVSSDISTILGQHNFEFVEGFAQSGTEAFLARLNQVDGSGQMLILVFRGTQPNIRDVLTDIKTDLVAAPGGGRIHRGFLEAFDQVRDLIEATLTSHKGPPVYIAGHSLGGALALIATRYLERESTGACYTFGGPRVADDRFFEGIKTPVYRVVNAADGVPRVPFGFGLKLVLGGLRLIPLNGTFQISEWLRRNLVGYTHYGSLIFLSTVPTGPESDSTTPGHRLVRKSPNFFWRSWLVLRRLLMSWGKAAAGDHAIRDYAEKLKQYAQSRNKPQE
ncbi:lipase family protein [Marinobacter sp.]|uniref:lipase family protein n=1 Tax=Marinobacter sp. TaxID=50741 RepID=UPI002B4733F4|nr:lipase family protein [Marinobacter sp.]HKK56356.1 lipase family protein [Marinobacter sp.]